MKLPLNFELNKYGIYVRLVDESDAEFIISQRNEYRARFLNSVSSDIDNQKKWLNEYKKREHAGIDYYFIYYLNGKPVGLNRIYNIQKDSFIGGSFVFDPKCDFEIPIFATLIQMFIGFEILDKSIYFGNIHINNKKALKFNRLIGADLIYENNDEYFVVLSKKSFANSLPNLEHKLLS